MFAYGTKLVDPESQRFSFLLLSVSILKKLLHSSYDVRKLWLCHDSEHNILSSLFRAVGHCKYHARTQHTVCMLQNRTYCVYSSEPQTIGSTMSEQQKTSVAYDFLCSRMANHWALYIACTE